MKEFDIASLGWDEFFSDRFASLGRKGYLPGRVAARNAHQYSLYGRDGEQIGLLSGKILNEAAKNGELPVVGDWVAMEPKGSVVLIHAVLERKTCFARKPAISGGRKLKHGVMEGGSTTMQALAANIDTVFIVSGLDGDFNAARTERYLTVAAAGGCKPVLLLNKADLCPDPAKTLTELDSIAGGCPRHVVSAETGLGLVCMAEYLKPGRTVAFLGSSGVGKSTIINRLFGVSLQNTGDVNAATGKGRHTTSRAELFVHESGSMLIDTPGIRELQLWCDSQAVEDTFGDVADLIRQCRFNDCRHGNEPGCAIREALQNGSLASARYQNFCKLDEESRRLQARKKQREIYLGRREKVFRS